MPFHAELFAIGFQLSPVGRVFIFTYASFRASFQRFRCFGWLPADWHWLMPIIRFQFLRCRQASSLFAVAGITFHDFQPFSPLAFQRHASFSAFDDVDRGFSLSRWRRPAPPQLPGRRLRRRFALYWFCWRHFPPASSFRRRTAAADCRYAMPPAWVFASISPLISDIDCHIDGFSVIFEGWFQLSSLHWLTVSHTDSRSLAFLTLLNIGITSRCFFFSMILLPLIYGFLSSCFLHFFDSLMLSFISCGFEL